MEIIMAIALIAFGFGFKVSVDNAAQQQKQIIQKHELKK
jgi:hypothetical protein